MTLRICPVCSQKFDIDKEEFVKKGNRYYHKTCQDKTPMYTKESDPLYYYLKTIYGKNLNYQAFERQFNSYKKELNLSAEDMVKIFKWYFEIENHKYDPEYDGIGILPYIYQKALRYYEEIELAQKRNENQQISQTVDKVIIIPVPQANIKHIDFWGDEEYGK